MEQIHASCVSLDDVGLLIRGTPGSGKSDLAARLIDGGGELVADDRVDLTCRDGTILAAAPETIAGLLEIRGVGILRMPHRASARIGLVIDLVDRGQIERVPEAAVHDYMGIAVPLLRLWPFEPSAAAKVRFAVKALKGVVTWIS